LKSPLQQISCRKSLYLMLKNQGFL
jgi:hypothetical protein